MAKRIQETKELREFVEGIWPNLVYKYKLRNTQLLMTNTENTTAEQPFTGCFAINFSVNDIFSKKHQLWLKYLGLTKLSLEEQCIATLLHEIRHIIQMRDGMEFYDKGCVTQLKDYMFRHDEMDANVWMLNELSNLDMGKVLFVSNNTKTKHLNTTFTDIYCVKRVDNNTKHRRTKT
jgi:hypothetical protein